MSFRRQILGIFPDEVEDNMGTWARWRSEMRLCTRALMYACAVKCQTTDKDKQKLG